VRFLQAVDRFLGLFECRQCLTQCDISLLLEFLCFFRSFVGFLFLLVGDFLFVFCNLRFSTDFVDEYVGISSFLGDIDHLDFQLFLKSLDLGLGFS
jgi:hypothetical protein